ncbi:Cof-type HAD-IIB family hydrolase [Actinomyces sp. B33]|uniref:HAD hydrolase family protein n=1 Tax=Actinomyces sp. B33 TaxID=2942131 RepID=UPI0023405838|nr:HAD family hydrolase [Actinomyces sp. B33]MDC4232915.1 Cof-type HAD-IIB family hydrolase [Actinomyces sp. B33]
MIAHRTRLVFVDLDGTLFDRTQRPPESAVRACRDAVGAGHTLMLCTGRSVPEIYPWVWDLGFAGIIGAAGAYVRVGEDVLLDRRIGAQDIRRITTVWDDVDGMWIWQGPDAMHPKPGYMSAFLATAGESDGDWADYADSVGPFVRTGLPESSSKCTVYIPSDRADLEALRPRMPEGFQVIGGSVGAGDALAVELMPDDISKGTGIRLVCERLEVDVAETIAIGDSTNDIDALRTAGTGVAMGGSADEVLSVADLVAPRIDEDGFAWAFAELDLI